MKVNGRLHAPASLPQGKSTWYPLDRKLGGPQSRSGHGGEEKNSHPLPEIEPPIIWPIAQRYTTELSRRLTVPSTGRNHHLLIANKAFEDVENFRYLRKTVTNQPCIHEEIKSRLNSWNVCYYSLQSLWFSVSFRRTQRLKYRKL
jgi:hypothetical protein